MAQWDDLLQGSASAEETNELISKGAARLQAFLAAESGNGESIHRVFERRFQDAPDGDTFDELLDALNKSLGRELASLVTWVLLERDGEERLQLVERLGAPGAAAFLRGLAGAFGPEFKNARALWNENPNDWRVLNREVFYELIQEKYVVRLKIQKYNGEELLLEAPANSILWLVNALIKTLRAGEIKDAFTADAVAEFVGQVKDFLAPFKEEPQPEAVSAKAPRGAGEAGLH